MMECDRARQMEIGSYSFTSDYVLQNKDRHAEMVVRWTRHTDGVKEFAVISESGDGGVRKHVFHRLLQAEVEASRPEQQVQTRITLDNYSFELTGIETVNGREAFVLDLEPRNQSKYLTRGRNLGGRIRLRSVSRGGRTSSQGVVLDQERQLLTDFRERRPMVGTGFESLDDRCPYIRTGESDHRLFRLSVRETRGGWN
jgi:hypothetical protein